MSGKPAREYIAEYMATTYDAKELERMRKIREAMKSHAPKDWVYDKVKEILRD